MGFYLLFLVFLTVPFFYLYGLVTFLKKIFDKSPTKTQEPLLDRLKKAARTNPSQTIEQFLTQNRATPTHTKQSPYITFSDSEPSGPTSTSKPATILEPSTSKLNSWYTDNSINLLLFLGAFMVVAAVSLFISFQWQSFSGSVKFTSVAIFTLAWFMAGHVAYRFAKVRIAGISFLAIAALLIPFNGLAWQQFMIGSLRQPFGTTWLVTSLISLSIYLYLTLMIKQRFFSYFAQLSLLSTCLAYVNLNQGPLEFYVFASVMTAIVLLLARVFWFKPHADSSQDYGTDLEKSSLLILIVANMAGILLLPQTQIGFFSMPVALVLILDSLYVWLWYTLRPRDELLGLAQIVTMYSLGHVLKVVGLPDFAVLSAMAVANLAQQLGLNFALASDYKRFRTSKIISVLLTTSIYLLGLGLNINPMLLVLLSLIPGLQAAIAATDLKQNLWHLLSGISVFVSTIHLVSGLELDSIFLPLALLLVGLVMLGLSLINNREISRLYLAIALTGLSVNASYHLILASSAISLTTNYPSLFMTAVLVTAYITSLCISGFQLYTQHLSQGKIFSQAALAGTGLIYIASWWVHQPHLYLILILMISFQAYTALKIYKRTLSWVLMILTWHLSVFHAIHWLDLDSYAYVLGLSVVNIFLMIISTHLSSFFPKKFASLWSQASIVSATIVAIFSFTTSLVDPASGWSLYRVACLVSGYIWAGLCWIYVTQTNRTRRIPVMLLVCLILWCWFIAMLDHVYPEILWLTNVQLYSLPIGLYLFWLSFYSRKNLFHPDVIMGLAGFSLGVIYVPTIIQAITQTSPLYPALMIGYGMLHLFVGNQTRLKLYQYAGAAAILLAVILETSDFIWALPRWLLIGGLGLGLISLAVGLLLRRNDKK